MRKSRAAGAAKEGVKEGSVSSREERAYLGVRGKTGKASKGGARHCGRAQRR